MSNEVWIASAVVVAVLCAFPSGLSLAQPGGPDAPPPAIRAWMDRLTVDHAYDPATGFIVAKEVIALPPVLADAPPLEQALKQARDEADGRIVVAFATADRCAPCQEFKKSALNDPRVVAVLERGDVLATHVEVDRTPEVAQKHLGGLAIPMTYALYGGERLATLRGQRSAEELLAWLDALPKDAQAARLALETNAWHAERIERLTAEDGWLSLVGLAWLKPGANRVGSDPAGEVVYAGFPAGHVATLHVEGGAVRIEPAAGGPSSASLVGRPDDGRMTIDTKGSPTVIAVGDIRFHVIDRGGRLALRIKDAGAPTRTGFAGIDRFPVDPQWRIVAAFEPAVSPQTVTMGTVLEGVDAEEQVFGWARFERDGHAVRAVLFPAGDGGSYLRFGDATNGSETYPIGRYLSVPPPSDDGTVVLDFNRSYNPPCAFTPYATCTLPPEPNEFPFGVPVGERRP